MRTLASSPDQDGSKGASVVTPVVPESGLFGQYEADIARKARVAWSYIAGFAVVMFAALIFLVSYILEMWLVALASVAVGYFVVYLLVRALVRRAKRLDHLHLIEFKFVKPRLAIGTVLTVLGLLLFAVAGDQTGFVRQGTDLAGAVAGLAFLPIIVGYVYLISAWTPVQTDTPPPYAQLQQWSRDSARQEELSKLTLFQKSRRRANMYWKVFGIFGVASLAMGLFIMTGVEKWIVVVASLWILLMALVNFYMVRVYDRRIPLLIQQVPGQNDFQKRNE